MTVSPNMVDRMFGRTRGMVILMDICSSVLAAADIFITVIYIMLDFDLYGLPTVIMVREWGVVEYGNK